MIFEVADGEVLGLSKPLEAGSCSQKSMGAAISWVLDQCQSFPEPAVLPQGSEELEQVMAGTDKLPLSLHLLKSPQ